MIDEPLKTIEETFAAVCSCGHPRKALRDVSSRVLLLCPVCDAAPRHYQVVVVGTL